MSRRSHRLAAALVIAAALTLTGAAAAPADHHQVSLLQDDGNLIDSSTPMVEHTLGILEALGVQQVRVNVQWATIAPDPQSYSRPPGFDATDPADYPASGWAPYDRLVQLAPLYGIRVEFNLTAPGPLWAMGRHPQTARAADHWYPNATEFFRFVMAVGRRYSGSDGEPRVSLWSIWNEPNQPGWLAPQWARVRGRWVRASPRLYRSLLDYAWYGLYFSGHSHDTILIGETAPEGYETPGFYTPITPLPFLRDLYCVDARGRRLRGAGATAVGCPASQPSRRFARLHRLLFTATGYAHHPYYFFHPPSFSSPEPNFVPLANLGRLERLLDGAFRAYGVHRRIPIYFTEYGYQTDPPDPYQVVSPAQQAAYLNQADFIAWSNPRVRSVAQFLLYDAPPDTRYAPTDFDYWDTFQSGLLFQTGQPKPALYAYRMPIWIPHPSTRRGRRLYIWGQVRPADRLGAQPVSVLWRAAGGGRAYRPLATARTGAEGYLTVRVRVPGRGYVKLAWRAPGGPVLHSRAVPVSSRP